MLFSNGYLIFNNALNKLITLIINTDKPIEAERIIKIFFNDFIRLILLFKNVELKVFKSIN